jgi:hypothetical protein
MSDGLKYTIDEFTTAIEGVQGPTPRSDELNQPDGYSGFKEQWLRWLSEYLTRGYYDRKTSVDDAKTAYQHLQNAGMIVWLNEAAGEDRRIIDAAIIAAKGRDSKQTEAKYARLVLPWEGLAKLLFGPRR